jgi:hypothetical protein
MWVLPRLESFGAAKETGKAWAWRWARGCRIECRERLVGEKLWALSARELGVLLRSGRASVVQVVQVVQAVLAPRINAYITVVAEEALADAHRCDAELAAGRDRGPLHAIPLVVKDLYEKTGKRSTAGSCILADRPAVGGCRSGRGAGTAGGLWLRAGYGLAPP